ncbi:hypothetical protein BKA82DRAFT_4009733 [Pisolithus tinctorius]|nr:hypothetical protein BKA82DRAFT_4009733 [Pisolithus tinctorius]
MVMSSLISELLTHISFSLSVSKESDEVVIKFVSASSSFMEPPWDTPNVGGAIKPNSSEMALKMLVPNPERQDEPTKFRAVEDMGIVGYIDEGVVHDCKGRDSEEQRIFICKAGSLGNDKRHSL